MSCESIHKPEEGVVLNTRLPEGLAGPLGRAGEHDDFSEVLVLWHDSSKHCLGSCEIYAAVYALAVAISSERFGALLLNFVDYQCFDLLYFTIIILYLLKGQPFPAAIAFLWSSRQLCEPCIIIHMTIIIIPQYKTVDFTDHGKLLRGVKSGCSPQNMVTPLPDTPICNLMPEMSWNTK